MCFIFTNVSQKADVTQKKQLEVYKKSPVFYKSCTAFLKKIQYYCKTNDENMIYGPHNQFIKVL